MSNTAPGMNQTGVEKEFKKKKKKASMETRGYTKNLGSVDFVRLKSLREEPQCSRTQNLYWIQLNGEVGQIQTTERGVGLLHMDKQGTVWVREWSAGYKYFGGKEAMVGIFCLLYQHLTSYSSNIIQHGGSEENTVTFLKQLFRVQRLCYFPMCMQFLTWP